MDAISLSVRSLETSTDEKINKLRNEVELKVTDDSVQIQIQEAISDGVKRVDTGTGFVFDENGMTVDKTNSETDTTITENGMVINDKIAAQPILTANKDGVGAKNLHSKEYLIIGKGNGRSRFEDYGNNRTACFWIGV